MRKHLQDLYNLDDGVYNDKGRGELVEVAALSLKNQGYAYGSITLSSQGNHVALGWTIDAKEQEPEMRLFGNEYKGAYEWELIANSLDRARRLLIQIHQMAVDQYDGGQKQKKEMEN